MNEHRIKKERTVDETTVALDLGILSIGTIVRIFQDMQEEIAYRKEENDKLRTTGKSTNTGDVQSAINYDQDRMF
jgi:hypothetical protein